MVFLVVYRTNMLLALFCIWFSSCSWFPRLFRCISVYVWTVNAPDVDVVYNWFELQLTVSVLTSRIMLISIKHWQMWWLMFKFVVFVTTLGTQSWHQSWWSSCIWCCRSSGSSWRWRRYWWSCVAWRESIDYGNWNSWWRYDQVDLTKHSHSNKEITDLLHSSWQSAHCYHPGIAQIICLIIRFLLF